MFVSLPTGAGNSLCYSLLPKAFDFLLRRTGSIVVVVSPLMQEQSVTSQPFTRGVLTIHWNQSRNMCRGYQLVYSLSHNEQHSCMVLDVAIFHRILYLVQGVKPEVRFCGFPLHSSYAQNLSIHTIHIFPPPPFFLHAPRMCAR